MYSENIYDRQVRQLYTMDLQKEGKIKPVRTGDKYIVYISKYCSRLNDWTPIYNNTLLRGNYYTSDFSQSLELHSVCSPLLILETQYLQ